MVFNDPRAKTKTVLEMKCKKDSESSRFLAVSDSWCLLSQSNVDDRPEEPDVDVGDGGHGLVTLHPGLHQLLGQLSTLYHLSHFQQFFLLTTVQDLT